MNGTSKQKRDVLPITPVEACELLQSAISYMHQAGYAVRAGNRNGELLIVVPGAEIAVTDAGTVIRPCQHQRGSKP